MRRGGGRRRGAMRARRMAVMRSRRMRRRRRRRRILLVGGLVAFGAYKMSKKDAQKIEEHTGTSPEEMTDEELERAMAELNIEKQYREDSDLQDPADQGDYEEEQPSYLDELERLSQLKEQGVITEEEFETKKKQLLGL